MTASYYFSPIVFSEVIDGRLEHLGIYVRHDEEGYEFFDGWNRVSAYIEDGSLRGIDANSCADPGNVLDAIVEIWGVVVVADHDQPFAVVAAPDQATPVTAQAEADEHYFRKEWQSALNKRTELVSELARSLNGEPVLMTLGGPLARIAGMAQRIIQ